MEDDDDDADDGKLLLVMMERRGICTNDCECTYEMQILYMIMDGAIVDDWGIFPGKHGNLP